MTTTQDVYYVSGSTAILAEDMGKALLAQFQGIRFREEKIPFIHTPDDARNALEHILQQSGRHPAYSFLHHHGPGNQRHFQLPESQIFRHLS